MVTLRIVFGLGVGHARHPRQARAARCSARSSTRRTSRRRSAATLAFVFLLNPGTGPVNTILGKLGLPQPGWFNDPAWSKPALTLLALWGIGDLMVIFMAALLDVPRELYEAAELDGAGAVRRFRHVTLPHLRRSWRSRWSPA